MGFAKKNTRQQNTEKNKGWFVWMDYVRMGMLEKQARVGKASSIFQENQVKEKQSVASVP